MSKRKSPAFSFYPADWLSSPRVTAMTPEEEGAYIRLLCYAWGNSDCSLPDDDQILASLSRLGERWNTCSTKLKNCFTARANKPGKLFNERLLEERKKQKENSRKRSEAGIKSGAARRKVANTCSTDVQQNANKTRTKSNLSSSSSSSIDSKGVNPLKPPALALPIELDSDEFRIAWGDWIQHRSEIKKPLKPKMASGQLSMLAEIGCARAVAMIRHTIAMGWQGLREPDGSHVNSQGQLAPTSRAPTDEDLKNWNPVDGGLGATQ